MSSMLSAPATIPATREVTFGPAFAPLSVGTDRWSWASSWSPAERDDAMIGPAQPTTQDSDHRTLPTSPRTCEKVSPTRCPLRLAESNREEVRLSCPARAFSFYGTVTRPTSSVDRGLGALPS